MTPEEREQRRIAKLEKRLLKIEIKEQRKARDAEFKRCYLKCIRSAL
jgi:hypothetical protein